jgi:hypothetical protein
MTGTKDRQQAASDAIVIQPRSETEIHRFTVQTPDIPNVYGSGTCAPDSVDLIYDRFEDGRRKVSAEVRGSWRRPGGELTEARVTCHYTNSPAEWPDWLAGMAHDYHPEPHLPLPGAQET